MNIAWLPMTESEARSLADVRDTTALARASASLRDSGFANVVTYSRKVFIPLTTLCRDVCHYCTFAKTPRQIAEPFLSVDEVLDSCRAAEAVGCKEALFTLGERPELRYRVARDALADLGFETTLDYVAHVAGRVLAETGLLPHINAGCMSAAEIEKLRPVSASMGVMLESASERLCEKGMPHYGSPDKLPAVRLATIERAGECGVPFTSGILIGIGETRRERIESLLQLQASHERHGHVQEIIIQNFRAKPDTKMADAVEPDLEELIWTIAVARLIFGADMSIQAPPNLSPNALRQLVSAGINDWGGISPVTPDFVNPEAPWPHLAQLEKETASAGKYLVERLTIYPAYAVRPEHWLDDNLRTTVLRAIDAGGYPRSDDWVAGELAEPPVEIVERARLGVDAAQVSSDIVEIVARGCQLKPLEESEISRLFDARGNDFSYVCRKADELRTQVNGDVVSYAVNRNINYTNICYFKCQFCAFSKGKRNEHLRGKPYDLDTDEIARRSREAWARGATEVCMQGGIHPHYTGQTYIDIVKTVKGAAPQMHVHAFSPLEVWQGAKTLGVTTKEFLRELQSAGLGSLPGTAAEILDDDVRATICPDKLSSNEWLEVIETAHAVGLRTTATMMFGHVDGPRHWARHLIQIRELQRHTGGFTEFVPLPFVPTEAPIYARGEARQGPSFREAVLVHAVARIVFHDLIDNIQASWVKLGTSGVAMCLQAGANDVGGTLMNESITRAAGAKHGQEWSAGQIESTIRSLGRIPLQRTTLYGTASVERNYAAKQARPLASAINTAPGKNRYERPQGSLVRRLLNTG
jgi:FO synthase